MIGQTWRDGARQANLARLLTGTTIAAIDAAVGRRIGELLARNGSTDIIDAHVALMTDRGDTVITSDKGDLTRLLATRDVRATVFEV